MIYPFILFALVSFVFLTPKYRWILLGHIKSKTKEEKVCILFGKYMRDIAIVMGLLYMFEHLGMQYSYVIVTVLFIMVSIKFAFRLHFN